MCASSKIRCPKDLDLSMGFSEEECINAKKNGKCEECWKTALAYKIASEKMMAANEVGAELKSLFSCNNMASYNGKVVHNTITNVVVDYTDNIMRNFEKDGI